MKKLKLILASLLTAGSMALVPVAAGAVQVLPQCTTSQTKTGNGTSDSICASKNDNISGIIKNVVDILLYIVGAVSVIMLIVGGLRYVTSAGNSAGVKSAKDTIMYALIGLVVAILAITIVNFVIAGITTGKTS